MSIPTAESFLMLGNELSNDQNCYVKAACIYPEPTFFKSYWCACKIYELHTYAEV